MTNEFSCFNDNLTGLIPLVNYIDTVTRITGSTYDCDYIIRPRTEKGWTVDMVFDASGHTWTDNSIFYYLGISGATGSTEYIDNNLSFSFTSEAKIKWKSYKYVNDGQYKIFTDTTSSLTGTSTTPCTGVTADVFNLTITFDRNIYLEGECNLENNGGVNDLITNSTTTNAVLTLSGASEIVVYDYGFDKKWKKSKNQRLGTLKIYLNGKPIYKLYNWEEIIPSQRNSSCPLVQVFGSGTTGCENIHFGTCNLDIIEINYYEEPLNFVEINKLYDTKLQKYDFKGCYDCSDIVTGITYTVGFYDYNGTLLKLDNVPYRGTAIPPTNPTRSGYTFTGWYPDYSNVQYDLYITAQYEPAHLVKFFDYDGTFLSSQYVSNGGTAIPPTPPTYNELTFNTWIGNYSNITGETSIISSYNTLSGRTYMHITLDSNTGLAPTFYTSYPQKIYFGDGGSTETFFNGATSTQHTYSSYGDYVVSFEITSNTGSSIGQSWEFIDERSVLMGTYSNAIKTVYEGNVGISGYALRNCNKVTRVELSGVVTYYRPYAFYGTTGLTSIVIPSNIRTGTTSLYKHLFDGSSNLLKYVFLSTTPPLLEDSTVFTGLSASAKIYVPDSSVNAYKSATYWSTHASKIYPLSTMT